MYSAIFFSTQVKSGVTLLVFMKAVYIGAHHDSLLEFLIEPDGLHVAGSLKVVKDEHLLTVLVSAAGQELHHGLLLPTCHRQLEQLIHCPCCTETA